MEITKDEARIIYQGLRALAETARSDEPHTSYTQEYHDLFKKIKDYADVDAVIQALIKGK